MSHPRPERGTSSVVEVASATYAALLRMLAGMALLRHSEPCGQGDSPVAEGAAEGQQRGKRRLRLRGRAGEAPN